MNGLKSDRGRAVNDKKRLDSEELLRAIAFTWLNLRRRGKRMLADMEHDLTWEQILVLSELDREDGLQLTVLADRLDREHTTMSRMVDGLEKRNLAVRVAAKDDKRQRLVYLTRFGRKQVEQLQPMVDELIGALFKGVSAKQTEVALECLQTLIRNMAVE